MLEVYVQHPQKISYMVFFTHHCIGFMPNQYELFGKRTAKTFPQATPS